MFKMLTCSICSGTSWQAAQSKYSCMIHSRTAGPLLYDIQCGFSLAWQGPAPCDPKVLPKYRQSACQRATESYRPRMIFGSAGEDVVTKDSFISILWRLIPYWLNNWEQQWGSECNSMMFELPHFALELLVVLPCIQVCSHPCSPPSMSPVSSSPSHDQGLVARNQRDGSMRSIYI